MNNQPNPNVMTITETEVTYHLRYEKGFNDRETAALVGWWRGNWPWLFQATAAEIRAASVDALAEE